MQQRDSSARMVCGAGFGARRSDSWGWFYLSTILDDYSHYVVAWKLCTTRQAEDVMDKPTLALKATSLDTVRVAHRPRLLNANGIQHIHGAPTPPKSQGNIERWHQTLKNRVVLENYFLPGDLEAQIDAFVDAYNTKRYHESLGNLTPTDVFFERDRAIIESRRRIK